MHGRRSEFAWHHVHVLKPVLILPCMCHQVGRATLPSTTSTTSRLGSGLVGALRGLQDSAEREVGRKVAGRIEGALAAAAAKTDWTPSAPPGRGASPWVDGLLSYLQVWAPGGVGGWWGVWLLVLVPG
jgi:hypothetical protein